MMNTIAIAGREIRYRLTSGVVRDVFPVRRGLRLELSPDNTPSDTVVFQLNRSRALEPGERVTAIEFEGPDTGVWTVVGVACHSTRTWFLDCVPTHYLTEARLVRRRPSDLEVVGFSIIGAACLMLTIAGFYWLAPTPVLLPLALYSGREFQLRRTLARQSNRMITLLDVLSTDAIGPMTWRSQFAQRHDRCV